MKDECDKCHRPGRLVCQYYHPGSNWTPLKVEPFVFRYYLCQWHRAGTTRRNKREGKDPIKIVPYKSDADVIDEYHQRKKNKS